MSVRQAGHLNSDGDLQDLKFFARPPNAQAYLPPPHRVPSGSAETARGPRSVWRRWLDAVFTPHTEAPLVPPCYPCVPASGQSAP